MNRRRILVCSAILGALVGCEDEGPTGREVPTLCEQGVTITVGTGLTPSFEWSPVCRVTMLQVRDAETDIPVWTLLAGPFNGLTPPVTYGTAPPGAITSGPDEEALAAGTSYILVLRVADIFAGEYEVGRREFTP